MGDNAQSVFVQYLSIVIATVSIIVVIILYLCQRRFKSLVYEKIYRLPVLREKEIKEKLKILYDGEPVEGVFIILLNIRNAGNIPIVAQDFYDPIYFKFDDKANILSAEISETNPRDLDIQIKINGPIIIIKPVLLNSGDSILLKVIVCNYNYDSKLEVGGRIVGVKTIKEYPESRARTIKFGMLGGLIMMFAGLTPIIVRTLYTYTSWNLLAMRWFFILVFFGIGSWIYIKCFLSMLRKPSPW